MGFAQNEAINKCGITKWSTRYTFLPEINGARNLITVVSLDDVEIAEQRCCNRPLETGCTDEFCELASVIMQEKNIEMLKTAEYAVILYSVLTDEIQKLLYLAVFLTMKNGSDIVGQTGQVNSQMSTAVEIFFAKHIQQYLILFVSICFFSDIRCIL